MTSSILRRDAIAGAVQKILAETPITDIHTHVYDPALGSLLLWGIDELLTYHYLVAEVLRARPDLTYNGFWAMERRAQADLVWSELFVKRSPLSEACRGVLTVLQKLGMDPNAEDLSRFRDYFAARKIEDYVNEVFGLANVGRVYMTNDPLDPQEGPRWTKGFERDRRFMGVLRLDSAITGWPEPANRLRALGYDIDTSLSGRTLGEVRRYLNDWCDTLDARYMAVSLPPSFRYPDPASAVTALLSKAVFPVALERRIPTAMMIGVRKLANPMLRLAGDSVGKADIEALERIAADFGDNRFLVTMLSRENTHELCIAARKFKNVTPFGCWWFLNNPSLIRETTLMRIETLGLSFVPQHSDARVLDQLIYKWDHSRTVIGAALAEKYIDMLNASRNVTADGIRRDIDLLFNSPV